MLIDPTENKGPGVVVRYEGSNTVVSKYSVDEYKVMTIEEFKKDIVPTLEPSEAEGNFHYYVLRDLSRGRYLTVLPDCVIDYKVSGVTDIKGDAFIDDLIATSRREEAHIDEKIINMNLPVFGYGEDKTRWRMTVKTPETKFQFRCPNLFKNEDEYPWVYIPPCLYTVVVNKLTGGLVDSYVKFLVEDSYDASMCKTAECCLPNVFTGNGRICRGDTHFKGISVSPDWPKMRLVTATWDLFLNSYWNFDLVEPSKFPTNMSELLAALPEKVDMPTDLSEKGSYLWRFLKLIETKGKWEEFVWPRTI